MYYSLTGPQDAPVVALLHGLGSSGDDWTRQTEALAAYRVLAIDLPGHHRSARPRGPLSVDGMAARVEQLLATLGMARAHVVGLSLGGCVGLALAVRAPARVRTLTVVNGFAHLRPSGLPAVARGAGRLMLALAAPMRLVGAYVAREAFPRPEDVELRRAVTARLAANPRRQYLASVAALMRFDIRDRLQTIRCPTLIVAGALDRTVPFSAKTLLARSIPGARLEVIDDSGHVSQYDQPVAFNRLLLAHLAAG
jgi:3-oxoadipate enol-lactonase